MTSCLVENIVHINEVIEKQSTIVPLMIFIIICVFFQFLFNQDKLNVEERRSRQQQAIEYLKLHEEEDKDFFMGSSNE